MPNEPIEELFVRVGADVSDLLKDVKESVDRIEKELGTFEKKGKKAFDETGKSAKGLTAVFQKLQAAATAFVAVFAISKVVNFFTGLAKSVVAARAEFETFETQFVTLLGSAGAARQRLQELAQFGAETPFNLNEVVEASRVLQVFGGDVLATGESLRTIGDIAAGVNRPFADVALWVGRMYDAMQSGRPFGEASARLQEMGALSGKARAELEKLQKEGASGTELWARFNELVGDRFAGNMERLSGTLQGVISNLEDMRDNLMRIGGEPLFEVVREDAKRFLDVLSDDKRRKAIEDLVTSLGTAAATLLDLAAAPELAALEDVDPEKIENLAKSIQDAADALSEFLDRDISPDINGLIDTLTILIDAFTSITNAANTAKSVLEPISPVINALRDAILGILFPVTNLIEGFGALNNIVGQLTGKELVDFSRDIAEASETEAQAADKAREAEAARWQGMADAIETAAAATDSIDDITDAIDEQSDKITEKLQDLAAEMIDLSEDRAEKLETLTQEHAQNVVNIETEYINERLALGHKLAEDLADLDEETASKRSDIIASTKEKLAKVAADSDQALQEERQSFQKDELRETEDHLKDMRRLRLSFLDNLEGAVKDRDAGRVRDLQRQFARENQQREEDFSTQQSRQREDQDLRLQQIRTNEQQRSQEIMQAQEKELQQLQEQESKKREAIQASFEEQLAKLDENRTTQLAKENQDFAERQTQLEEALAKRLETIAKALADEENINADEAQKILETLNEYFGAGGEIDKLMEDFAKRRRQKIEIEIDFKGGRKTASEGKGGGKPSTTEQFIPAFQTGGSMIARRPTLAQFGEVPEMVTFTPLHQMNNSAGQEREMKIKIEMSGSAPPGVRSADRDQIAMVLVNALRESGFNRVSGR